MIKIIFVFEGVPATSGQPATVDNPLASPCQPIPEYRRGEGVALEDRTSQTTQTDTQPYHSSSGQDPSRPRWTCGRRSRRQARKRTKEQARQPKPKPNLTTATQVKTQGGHGGQAGDGAGGRREQERTGTNTRSETQETKSPRQRNGKGVGAGWTLQLQPKVLQSSTSEDKAASTRR